MRIGALVKLLQSRDQNEELLVPAGPGVLTDQIRLTEVATRTGKAAMLAPREGVWDLYGSRPVFASAVVPALPQNAEGGDGALGRVDS